MNSTHDNSIARLTRQARDAFGCIGHDVNYALDSRRGQLDDGEEK